MTGQADGTVYINSTLDASGLKPGSKEIEVACRRAAKTVRAIEDAVNKAVQNAMSNQQRNNTYVFQAVLDRKVIFEKMMEEAELRMMMNGRNPYEMA